MNDSKFSFGQLTAPHPDDAEFDTAGEAIEAAFAVSLKLKNSTVFGVWQNDSGEILKIIYDGQIFKPE